LNILVCIKQVPKVSQVKIDPGTGTLIREGVEGIINPNDKNAMEEALVLRESHGGKVTAITMGPPQAEEALREALAMGVDEAILLCDRAFAGSDTLATSYILSTAIKKSGGFDLIICGTEATDGMTAHIGPQIAEYLHLPQVTYTRKVEVEGNVLRAERKIEDGYEMVETLLPALITVAREANEPRIAPIDGIMEAFEKEIVVWHAGDLDVDKDQTGLAGSPTQIMKSAPAVLKRGEGQILSGPVNEQVTALIKKLGERQLI